MAWEIKKRKADSTIWQGQDAEGRRIYAETTNQLDMPVEPTGAQFVYSKKIKCPRCGSERIFLDGCRMYATLGNRQKYRCRDCGHGFREGQEAK